MNPLNIRASKAKGPLVINGYNKPESDLPSNWLARQNEWQYAAAELLKLWLMTNPGRFTGKYLGRDVHLVAKSDDFRGLKGNPLPVVRS